MNAQEALSILEKADPTKTYCVTTQEWRNERSGRYDRYSVSVLPGFDGSPCQGFDGQTMTESVEAALGAVQNREVRAQALRARAAELLAEAEKIAEPGQAKTEVAA